MDAATGLLRQLSLHEERDNAARLGTRLRLALIQLIYLRAMDISQFSSLIEISLCELVERRLHLDVPDTVATLRRISPAAQAADEAEVCAERDTYARASSGYAAEHAQIFDPIERVRVAARAQRADRAARRRVRLTNPSEPGAALRAPG